MAGTVIADKLEAASTSTLVIKNGVASTPPTVQDSAGTEIGTFCRAWVNFNGTSTVAIRASFNVTSITDNGNGNYAVNFTTAMPDANYAVVAIAGDTSSGTCLCQSPFNTSPTTTSAQVFVTNSAFSGTDRPLVYAAIFR
jgi:hypothetical protein